LPVGTAPTETGQTVVPIGMREVTILVDRAGHEATVEAQEVVVYVEVE
jgi:hypothetical protein